MTVLPGRPATASTISAAKAPDIPVERRMDHRRAPRPGIEGQDPINSIDQMAEPGVTALPRQVPRRRG